MVIVLLKLMTGVETVTLLERLGKRKIKITARFLRDVLIKSLSRDIRI